MRAISDAVPGIHVHAFSALEVWQGAATLGLSLDEYLAQLRDLGLGSLPGTAAEVLDDEVRRVICPDKVTTAQWLAVHDAAHRVGLRSNVTLMFGHADTPRSWARHLLRARAAARRSGGFTEFVPLPFVPMEAPIYLQGRARRGPTFRETLLVHAVARLALHPGITNVQASWVKLGPEGTRQALAAGVNDLGGTLMNESISRSAGAEFGQEMPPERMEELIRSAGRVPRQRTTLYGDAPAERVRASFGAAARRAAQPPVKDAGLVAPPRLVRPARRRPRPLMEPRARGLRPSALDALLQALLRLRPEPEPREDGVWILHDEGFSLAIGEIDEPIVPPPAFHRSRRPDESGPSATRDATGSRSSRVGRARLRSVKFQRSPTATSSRSAGESTNGNAGAGLGVRGSSSAPECGCAGRGLGRPTSTRS